MTTSMYRALLSASVLVVIIFKYSSIPVIAFRVDFKAFDAMEQILRLQEPYSSLLRQDNNHQVESVADVPITPEMVWENDVAIGNMSWHCHKVMFHLAEQGGNFTHCLISHSRPFRVCEKCVEHYTRFTYLYDDLQKDDKCKRMLLMADRMQVITSVYYTLTSTWSLANCNLCFDSIEENFTTGHVTFNYTAETLFFQEMKANVSQCFKNYSHAIDHVDNSSEVCQACREIYMQMNTNFSKLNKKNEGHICMDLVDMMNYTRLMWSTHFNCRRPPVDASVVIAISVVVVIITVLLYSTSKLVAKIRLPQIFKPKRMKTCRGRYGAMSPTEESENSTNSAVGSVQAEGGQHQLYCTDKDGNA